MIPLDISEDVRKKILLELRTLHNAFHESIVTFYGAFYKVRACRVCALSTKVQEGAISICLELMDGGTLAEVIKGAPIPEPVLAHISLKVATAYKRVSFIDIASSSLAVCTIFTNNCTSSTAISNRKTYL